RPGLAHSPRARQQPGSEVRRRWRSARLIARSPAPVMGAGPFLRSGRASRPPVQGGPAAVAGRSSYPFSFRASISSIVRVRSLGSGRSLVASRGRPSPRSLRSGAASACCSHRSTSTDRSSEPMTYCAVGRFASMHTSQTRIVAIVLTPPWGGLPNGTKTDISTCPTLTPQSHCCTIDTSRSSARGRATRYEESGRYACEQDPGRVGGHPMVRRGPDLRRDELGLPHQVLHRDVAKHLDRLPPAPGTGPADQPGRRADPLAGEAGASVAERAEDAPRRGSPSGGTADPGRYGGATRSVQGQAQGRGTSGPLRARDGGGLVLPSPPARHRRRPDPGARQGDHGASANRLISPGEGPA